MASLSSAAYKVLVVHTWGIGDWLFFTPVLRLLREAHPELEVDLILGTPTTRAIVEFYPEVRLLGTADVRRGPWGIAIEALRSRASRYDALVFPAGINSDKADMLAALIRADGKAALRTSHREPIFLNRCAQYDGKLHLVDNNLKLAGLLGLRPGPEAGPYLPRPAVSARPVEGSVLIHPGSDPVNSYRRWPAERFASVAQALLREGRPVCVILGPGERGLAGYFSDLIDRKGFRLCEGLPFARVVELVAAHQTLLNSDSALGHIAAALGLRTISIFGPADPGTSGPYSPRAAVIRTSRKLECMPCVRPGGLYGCAPRPCLMDVGIEEVLAALSEGRAG